MVIDRLLVTGSSQRASFHDCRLGAHQWHRSRRSFC